MNTEQKAFHFFIMLLLSLIFSGCATNRSVLTITPPQSSPSMKADKAAFIKSITDNRSFMDKPPTPDIPSLGQGGIEKNDPALIQRAVGRKRNGFGKAIGDVFLAEGTSVQTMVRGSLETALTDLGYTVYPEGANYPPDAIVLDVAINKYWSWIDMGFWSIGIEAEIDTDVRISSTAQTTRSIYARASERVMAATESAWQRVLEKVLAEYMNEAKIELSKIKQ